MSFSIDPHIRGLIFDFDGTLIDTMPLHYLAWRDTVQVEGAHFPEELFYELAGVPSDTIVEILNDKFGYALDPETIAPKKEQHFLNHYLTQAQPIEPIIEIVRAQHGQRPMAIATGAIPVVLQAGLQALGLSEMFEAQVTSVDVAHGKPAPDTFLEAARRLEIAPKYCQVFEDSDMGLEAAARAGMAGVDIRQLVAATRRSNVT